MKFRISDRFLLFLGGVLAILSGAALIVAGLQFLGVFAESIPLGARVGIIVWGVLLIALGVYLITFPRRYAAGRKEFVVQRTDNGELRIAVKAIQSLVQKCIDLHEEIQLKSMQIINSREGVVVDLNVSLANNISIPLAVASLQKQIKQYLAASSGIEVKEVRVSVESTEDDPSMFELREDEEAAEPEKAPAKEKKAPLHRRLFGTQDQPATVPEPPKPEKEAPVPPEETPAEPAEDAGQDTGWEPQPEAENVASAFEEDPEEEASTEDIPEEEPVPEEIQADDNPDLNPAEEIPAEAEDTAEPIEEDAAEMPEETKRETEETNHE